MLPFEDVRALGHPDESEAAAGFGLAAGVRRGAEAPTIILYADVDDAAFFLDEDGGPVGPRMFDDVVKALLHDAVKVYLGVLGECAVERVDVG